MSARWYVRMMDIIIKGNELLTVATVRPQHDANPRKPVA